MSKVPETLVINGISMSEFLVENLQIKVKKTPLDEDNSFYYKVRAIVDNKLYVESKIEHGKEKEYIKTITSLLQEQGLQGISSQKIEDFMATNNIKLSISITEEKKENLSFEENEYLTDIENKDIRLCTKSYLLFLSKLKQINKEHPRDSNESKAIKLLALFLKEDINISGLDTLMYFSFDFNLNTRKEQAKQILAPSLLLLDILEYEKEYDKKMLDFDINITLTSLYMIKKEILEEEKRTFHKHYSKSHALKINREIESIDNILSSLNDSPKNDAVS